MGERIDYQQVVQAVREKALRQGRNPEEAVAELEATVAVMREQKTLGTEMERQRRELSASWNEHKDDLGFRAAYGRIRTKLNSANKCYVNNARHANNLAGFDAFVDRGWQDKPGKTPDGSSTGGEHNVA